MVDSITESDVYRIEDYVGGRTLDYESIEAELKAEGLKGRAISAFAEAVEMNRPDPVQERFGYELRERRQVEVVGHSNQGTERDVRVYDKRGRSIGNLSGEGSSEAVMWEDRWGNVMGKRRGTDMTEARVIIPKEDR